jgi:hypothetical protein
MRGILCGDLMIIRCWDDCNLLEFLKAPGLTQNRTDLSLHCRKPYKRLAKCTHPFLMFESLEPVCPECGSNVRETVSEFLFSGHELPSLENPEARITGHKCGCGHKFVVIAYASDERGPSMELHNRDRFGYQCNKT